MRALSLRGVATVGRDCRVMHRGKLLMLLRRLHVAHALVDAITRTAAADDAVADD
eukprot:COSAG02_NODE_10852_length_1845_cov_27.780641_2_plen_55_part_00